MKANAALVGATGTVVLDTVAREDLDLVVRQADRHLNLNLAVVTAHDGAHVVREAESLGGVVEVVRDDLEVGDLGRVAGRLGDTRRALVLAGRFCDIGHAGRRRLVLGHLSSAARRLTCTTWSQGERYRRKAERFADERLSPADELTKATRRSRESVRACRCRRSRSPG